MGRDSTWIIVAYTKEGRLDIHFYGCAPKEVPDSTAPLFKLLGAAAAAAAEE